jgi:hypothetical protein
MALCPGCAGGIDECPGAAWPVSLSDTEPFSASPTSASRLRHAGQDAFGDGQAFVDAPTRA